jgi:hypothetical protein
VYFVLTPHEFIHKWKQANLSAAADPDGAFYTFERGVRKEGGTKGWADVWMRGHFAWEYKKKHRDLAPPRRRNLPAGPNRSFRWTVPPPPSRMRTCRAIAAVFP